MACRKKRWVESIQVFFVICDHSACGSLRYVHDTLMSKEDYRGTPFCAPCLAKVIHCTAFSQNDTYHKKGSAESIFFKPPRNMLFSAKILPGFITALTILGSSHGDFLETR